MTSVALRDLIARCDAYSEAAGLSRSRVSTLVLNDGKRLQALKDGADITTRRLEAAHGRLDRLFADLERRKAA